MKREEITVAASMLALLSDSGGVLPAQGYRPYFSPGPAMATLLEGALEKLQAAGAILVGPDGTATLTGIGRNKGPGTWIRHTENLLKTG